MCEPEFAGLQSLIACATLRRVNKRWMVCAVLVMACGKSSSPPPSSGSGSGSGGSSAAAAPAAKPAAADAVYLDLDRKNGLVSIAGGAFEVVVPAGKTVGRLVPRKGGGVFVAVDGTLSEYDGEIRPIAGTPKDVDPRAVSPDGVLWAAGRGKVATYDGKAWSEPATGLPANELVTDYHFAADGTVFLVARNTIAVRRGGAWSTVTSPAYLVSAALAGTTLHVTTKDRVARLDGDKLVDLGKLESAHLEAGPGALYVRHLKGVQKIDGDKLVPVAKLPYLSNLAFGADGTIYGYGLDKKRIVRRAPDGTVDRIPAQDLPFDIESLAVDGRGRLWLKVHYGFVLIDGDKVTVVTPGTVPELTTRVDQLLVTGNGPDLPDVGAPKLINLTGKFVSGGKPKAGVKIELCPEAQSGFYGSSPCEGKGFVRRATSAADGSFTISDVPLGGWHIVYKKSADSWVYYFPDKCCGGLAKGATFDMGDVEFGRSRS
jgi:hypothetical protein